MIVLPPLTVTPAMLTASSIAEPASGETEWSAGVTHTLGATVVDSTLHKKYECLATIYSSTPPYLDTTHWKDVGPNNRWAMFDTLRNSASSATTSFYVTITPGQSINSLALLQVEATRILVTATSVAYNGGGTPFYTNDINMAVRTTSGWFDYFFGGMVTGRPSTIMFDIPEHSDVVLHITFYGETATCGACVIGNYVNLGWTQPGATVEALNFSTFDRDLLGNSTLVPRRSVPKTMQTIYAKAADIESIVAVRNTLNAVPAVWSGLNDSLDDNYFELLLILGFYRSFTIDIDNPAYIKIDLELEEV